jgi:predicted ArsR family transcriptional regulator
VVPAIWQAVYELGGDELAHKILKRVSLALAEHYRAKITVEKPQERLEQLVRLLTEEGGLIDAQETREGQLVLYKRSCPFISMVDERRSVCYIDQEMLSAIVGCPVRQTACRHEGDPCCAFEIVSE